MGHHLFQWFPADTDPWDHLRLGFEERRHNAGIDSWSMDKFHELNKVTCGEVISMVASVGFIIEQARHGKPTDENMALYDRFRSSFDPAILFDEQWLFEDWLSILARKP
ncbi:MAG: hypothetical protein LBD58_09725 [Treponema sp.]|nr:hypothetical protein [Treponema sp.]